MKEHPMLKDLKRIIEEYDSDEVAAGLRRYLDAAHKANQQGDSGEKKGDR